MKRLLLALLITGLMLCGCGNAEEEIQKTNETVATEKQEAEAETTEKAESEAKEEKADQKVGRSQERCHHSSFAR